MQRFGCVFQAALLALENKKMYEAQLQQLEKAMQNSAAEASDMDEDDLLAEIEQLDAELSEPAFPTKSMYTPR